MEITRAKTEGQEHVIIEEVSLMPAQHKGNKAPQQPPSPVNATYVEPSAEDVLEPGTKIGDLLRRNMTEPYVRISGRLIAAARALVGVSQADFADACGLAPQALCRLEAGGSAWVSSEAEAEAVTRGMSHFGVLIVEETDGMGAGVRLKFTRADVRQIARLESEGGITGADDAP